MTNLEGRVQSFHAGGLPPSGVPSDWLLLAGLIQKLGGSAPRELAAIRTALGEANSAYNLAEVRKPSRNFHDSGRSRSKESAPLRAI